MKDPIWVADAQKSQGTVLFFSENQLPLLVGLANVSSVQFILADARASSPPSTFAGLRFHVVLVSIKFITLRLLIAIQLASLLKDHTAAC